MRTCLAGEFGVYRRRYGSVDDDPHDLSGDCAQRQSHETLEKTMLASAPTMPMTPKIGILRSATS